MKSATREEYAVRIWKSKSDQLLRREWRNAGGDLHNTFGPAIELFSAQTGLLIEQRHFVNGRLHRDGAPAVVVIDGATGNKREEAWWQDGEIHRSGDLPAFTKWNPKTGLALEQFCFVDGRHHSDTTPAVIERHRDSGLVIKEMWYRYGKLHRDGDLPASIVRDEVTGIAIEESYALNDLGHRDVGPAEIKRDPDGGNILEVEYWRHGQKLPSGSDLDLPGP